MKTYQVRITCDGCGEAYESVPLDAPECKLDFTLLDAGWKFEPQGKHFCPECKKPNAETISSA